MDCKMNQDKCCKTTCPSKKLVILDTDFGIDRALCLNYLLALKDVDVLAVTLVSGNYEMEVIKDNACRILSFLQCEGVPVYAGGKFNTSGIILHNQGERVLSDSIYGDNGFANIELPDACNCICADMNAANALIYYGKKYYDQIHLIFTGPLTNLALAFLIDNEFPTYFRSITIYGITPYAEFNAIIDPLAVDIVSKCFRNIKRPITILDWSVVWKNLLPFTMIERILDRSCECGDNKFIDLFEILTNPHNQILKKHYWEGGYLAGALLLPVGLKNPDIFWSSKRVSVDVFLNGPCVGHTRIEENPHGNFLLITGIDREKAVENIIKVFKSA